MDQAKVERDIRKKRDMFDEVGPPPPPFRFCEQRHAYFRFRVTFSPQVCAHFRPAMHFFLLEQFLNPAMW